MAMDRNDSIDPNSPAYLFGKIMARLNEGEKIMERLALIVDETRKAVGNLPCDRSTQRLSDLEGWRKEQDETSRETKRTGVSFRNGLVLVLVSVFTSATIGSIVSILLS